MSGGYRYGSGRPELYDKTDEVLQLNVKRLHREGYLLDDYQEVTWRWSTGHTMKLRLCSDWMATVYKYENRTGAWVDVNVPG